MCVCVCVCICMCVYREKDESRIIRRLKTASATIFVKSLVTSAVIHPLIMYEFCLLLHTNRYVLIFLSHKHISTSLIISRTVNKYIRSRHINPLAHG